MTRASVRRMSTGQRPVTFQWKRSTPLIFQGTLDRVKDFVLDLGAARAITVDAQHQVAACFLGREWHRLRVGSDSLHVDLQSAALGLTVVAEVIPPERQGAVNAVHVEARKVDLDCLRNFDLTVRFDVVGGIEDAY